MDGIYSIAFRGSADWGIGLLLLRKGTVTGADGGGILYDGDYQDAGALIEFNITMSVPPGATLVQGTPARPTAYTISFGANIPRTALNEAHPVLLELPQGPVNVIFRRLRELRD